MLLQLTVDVAAAAPATRSDVAELLGRTAAEVFRRGHTADLHTIDPEAPPDKPAQETPDHARADGYATGYSDGFDKGYALAIKDRRTGPAVLLPDNPTHVELPPATGHPSYEQPVPASYFSPVPFPDTLPTPAGLSRHELGEPQPAAESHGWIPPNETTAVMPTMTNTSIGQAIQPDGPRPAAVPGAPVSAYDNLKPGVAHEAYGFPEYPDDRQKHTDGEGALWRFSGMPSREWARLSYPREWGPAAAGNFPAVHIDSFSHPRA